MRCDDALIAVSLRADGEPPVDGPAHDGTGRATAAGTRAGARDDWPAVDHAAGDPARNGTRAGREPADARALDAHLASCAGCRRFEREILRLRSHLRVEPVGRAPDLAPAVVARLRDAASTSAAGAGTTRDTGRPPVAGRRLAVAAAVAALAGMVAGATFVGLGGEPPSPAAAGVPERVLAAQHDIGSVDSRLTITQTGPAPAAPVADGVRTFDAHLTYRAPESLALAVRETTPGRTDAERAAGVLVVDGDRWWQETARQCSPAAGRVRCPDEAVTWSRSVSGREPFSDAAPVPLELVSPVDSFAVAAPPPAVGERTIAGHRAVGVAVSAAQVAPLLDGLSAGVDLRPVHPSDPVELWLDDEHLVPLALVVRAADDPARARWAAAAGAGGRPGEVVLRVETTDVRINQTGRAADDRALTTPAGEPSVSADAGFRAVAPDDPVLALVPVPADMPGSMRAYRSGTVATPGGPAVGVRSWSDGRAWLTVRATREWPGGRLFGDLGPDVRRVDLGPAGTAYATSDGGRVGLHAADLDIVVGGSLPADVLRRIAADLGVVGLPVPASWAEAATATLEDAAAALPGLLTARRLDGFGAPAVRVDHDIVSEVRAGPGDRTLTLTQRRSPTLPPPTGGDEAGVEIRGVPGRHSERRGELEWVENGIAVSLRSRTIGLDELLAIAAGLERA